MKTLASLLLCLSIALPGFAAAPPFPQRPITLVVPFAPGGGTDSLGRGPLLLVLNNDTGIKSVARLIEAAKQKPDALNYVSAGPGSINHLAGELFVQRTGARMTHIPYKGSAPATLDLVGGQAQVFFATGPTIPGQVKANKVTLVAATAARRSRLFPDLPTIQEAGVKDYAVETWWGIVGPAGLPGDIGRVLADELESWRRVVREGGLKLD